MDKSTLVKNVVALIKLAKVFKMPIVVSTVNVKAAGEGNSWIKFKKRSDAIYSIALCHLCILLNFKF
jgi:hypothetical protein